MKLIIMLSCFVLMFVLCAAEEQLSESNKEDATTQLEDTPNHLRVKRKMSVEEYLKKYLPRKVPETCRKLSAFCQSHDQCCDKLKCWCSIFNTNCSCR
ncbi:hypothetical protein EB796_000294 [Bugula neritina]|uniref:Uncharacterized protein n=1 Tax=Bugula neritina TaxID=10212 RepID=A0A7J7KT62_BUGNE|nr:hypothetical protein EB796_000299 [Bugula neritina]KAF6041396.1 hypothetical protein EB796_000294 [Bugula neritina]